MATEGLCRGGRRARAPYCSGRHSPRRDNPPHSSRRGRGGWWGEARTWQWVQFLLATYNNKSLDQQSSEGGLYLPRSIKLGSSPFGKSISSLFENRESNWRHWLVERMIKWQYWRWMHCMNVQPVGFTIITTTPRWFHSAASSGGEVWPEKQIENKLWLKEVKRLGTRVDVCIT